MKLNNPKQPGKDCVGWFSLKDIFNLPLGVIMKENLKLMNEG